MMNSAFDELLEIAKRMGIVVRHAALGGSGGGLASLKGQRQLFIDLNAQPADQLEQTVQALARLAELETIYLRPDLRALFDDVADGSSIMRASQPAPLPQCDVNGSSLHRE